MTIHLDIFLGDVPGKHVLDSPTYQLKVSLVNTGILVVNEKNWPMGGRQNPFT